MRKIIIYLAGFLLVTSLAFIITGNEHMFKVLSSTYFSGHTGPTLNDSKIFENRVVSSGAYIEIPKSPKINSRIVESGLWKKIESYEPVALVVIQNNEIILEKYWDNYFDSSKTNSFSVAKSIVGLAVLKAVELGLIKSMNQKVVDFVPELQGKYREEVTIQHLLSMTSGINFDENYGNPFGFMARAYYGDGLLEKTLSYQANEKPGEKWTYLGGNTILLSIILERLSGKNLSDFVSEHFWSKLGTSGQALWSLDAKGGMEKAYCCYYSTAIDFARFGMLVLNNGNFFGETVIDSNLIAQLKNPVVLNNGEYVPHYGLHWWRIQYNGIESVYARGILGQYIMVIPEYNMVIVRLGKKRGDKDEFQQPADVYHYLDLAKSLNYPNQN